MREKQWKAFLFTETGLKCYQFAPFSFWDMSYKFMKTLKCLNVVPFVLPVFYLFRYVSPYQNQHVSRPVDYYLSLGHLLAEHLCKNTLQIKHQSGKDNSLPSPA